MTHRPGDSANNAKKYHKALVALTSAVRMHIAALDREMKQPSSQERGNRIAAICNQLEISNDRARYFLGIDFRTDRKPITTEGPTP